MFLKAENLQWRASVALTVVTVLFGVVATAVTSYNYRRGDILRRSTVKVVWLTYLLAGTAVTAASWVHVWELDILAVIGWVLGGSMIAGGVALLWTAVVQFAGVEQLSGLEVGELVTHGVYQWSRNPQNLGLLVTFAGVSLAGRSLLALALTVILAVLLSVYLPREEAHLERVFGDRYRQYREQTSRWFGLKRNNPVST